MVTDNLAWWFRNGFVKESAEAIESKMHSYGYDVEEEHSSRVAFFIDCNCLEILRVGGGPSEDGANSGRWGP